MRSTVNVILTLTGTLSVIGMIVGIPLGIFLLAQKDTPTQPTTL
jgi:flagellar biosynthesis protein FliQ